MVKKQLKREDVFKDYDTIEKKVNERVGIWIDHFINNEVHISFLNSLINFFEQDINLLMGDGYEDEKIEIKTNFINHLIKLRKDKKLLDKNNINKTDKLQYLLNRESELMALYCLDDVSKTKKENIVKMYEFEINCLQIKLHTKNLLIERLESQLNNLKNDKVARLQKVLDFFGNEKLYSSKVITNSDLANNNPKFFDYFENKQDIIKHFSNRVNILTSLYAQDNIPIEAKKQIIKAFNLEMSLYASEKFKNDIDMERLELKLALMLENLAEYKKEGKKVSLNQTAQDILSDKKYYLDERAIELLNLYNKARISFNTADRFLMIFKTDAYLLYGTQNEVNNVVLNFEREINKLYKFYLYNQDYKPNDMMSGFDEYLCFWNKLFKISHSDIPEEIWINARNSLVLNAKYLIKIYKNSRDENCFDDVRNIYKILLETSLITDEINEELKCALYDEFNFLLAKAERRKLLAMGDGKNLKEINKNDKSIMINLSSYLTKKIYDDRVLDEIKDEFDGIYNFYLNYFYDKKEQKNAIKKEL